MSVVSMKALLESGVHFGHRTHKWHPKMKPFIFTERNGIHIINLQQTVKALDDAYALVRDTVASGGTILFVGTKRQAQETVQMEAIRAGMPYVAYRWLGGFLTNWGTIRQRLNELERLERMRERGDFEKLTKKEGLMLSRKIEKLETRLGGVRNMVKLPQLLFIVDVRREETAIHEANLLGMPVVGMVDTNCDPTRVDYIIPSNDDAIRAIKLIVGKIADAVIEGKAMRKDDEIDMGSYTRQPAGMEEDELSDDDLLGAATLEKIKRQEKATVVIVAEDDAELPDIEDLEVEEAAEEVVIIEDLDANEE